MKNADLKYFKKKQQLATTNEVNNSKATKKITTIIVTDSLSVSNELSIVVTFIKELNKLISISLIIECFLKRQRQKIE